MLSTATASYKKAYKVGLLHAVGGIPCRLNPAATQLVVVVIVDRAMISDEVKVYHFTSGQLNGIKLHQFCTCKLILTKYM